jgi:AcrR family transcriptional regulator
MPSTRTRRHLRTRQAILDAAREIISEDGMHALSMRALADRIDYSPAGLYEYFGGKEEIVSAVCQEGSAFLYDAMAQADPSLSPADYLYQIGRSYIQFALDHPDYFLVMFTEGSPPGGTEDEGPGEGEQDSESPYGLLEQAVQRGIDSGAFVVRSGFGLDEMAYAAWTLVHGMAMLRITSLRDYPADLDAADHQALANFLRGLQAA